jgi:tetratricopeptide (TPR) repeat protein
VHGRAEHLHADDSLDYAMRRIAASGMKALPVVSRENQRELKGTVSVADILDAYGIGRARPAEAEAAGADAIPGKRLFAVATAVLIVLGILAGLVNYGLGAERTARAERDYQAGNQLLARERTDEAIEQYRHALSIAHRFEYRLGPGEALIYLEEARGERPTNGPVNLAVAEAEMQAGQGERAVMHYQRAIYGTWPAGTEGERVGARLELADALLREGKPQQAEGELVSLAGDTTDDPGVQQQVAQRLARMGIHERAAQVYRQVAKSRPEVLGPLGEEELAAGDIAAACVAFQAGGIATRQALCAQMLAMDPAVPGLPAAERSGRSQALLAAVTEELQTCSGTAPGRQPAARNSEGNVALAVELWAKRMETCTAPPAPDAALTRVMSTMKHGAHTE